jgi:hypothetical protein
MNINIKKMIKKKKYRIINEKEYNHYFPPLNLLTIYKVDSF